MRPPSRLRAHLRNRAISGLRSLARRARGGEPAVEPEQLVGMTSREEQDFYETCSAEVARLEGRVVDLGCWLCSTTIPLVRGLRVGAGVQTALERVVAIDRFLWEPWMEHQAARLACVYEPGESFLPEARGKVRGMLSEVDLIQADLAEFEWTGEPVKLLLVDAMKSLELARRIVGQFFPCLPVGGLLLQQDFKHYYTPWIHVLQYRLREHFEPVHEVMRGGTVAFRLKKQVSPLLADQVLSDPPSKEDLQAVFDYSLQLVSSERARSAVAAAHVMQFVHDGEKAAALEVLHGYGHLEHPARGDFAEARKCVEAMAG